MNSLYDGMVQFVDTNLHPVGEVSQHLSDELGSKLIERVNDFRQTGKQPISVEVIEHVFDIPEMEQKKRLFQVVVAGTEPAVNIEWQYKLKNVLSAADESVTSLSIPLSIFKGEDSKLWAVAHELAATLNDYDSSSAGGRLREISFYNKNLNLADTVIFYFRHVLFTQTLKQPQTANEIEESPLKSCKIFFRNRKR